MGDSSRELSLGAFQVDLQAAGLLSASLTLGRGLVSLEHLTSSVLVFTSLVVGLPPSQNIST